MKKRTVLTTLLVCIIFSITSMANNIVSINSNDLTGSQKRALIYTKELLNLKDNVILLPLEINALIGDTITKEQYQATPHFEEAYFEEDKNFSVSLIVPLTVKCNMGVIKSFLYVNSNGHSEFYRILKTVLPIHINNTKNETYFLITSNIDGIMLRTILYDNNKIVEQIDGVVGLSGIIDYKKSNKNRKSIITERFTNINVLKGKGNNIRYDEFEQYRVNAMIAKNVPITPGSLTPAPQRKY